MATRHNILEPYNSGGSKFALASCEQEVNVRRDHDIVRVLNALERY